MRRARRLAVPPSPRYTRRMAGRVHEPGAVPPGPAGEAGPSATPAGVAQAVDRLVDECRAQCLWYARPDYYPRTDQERLEVLEAIQERCDLAVFRRAGVLKAWLSPRSSVASASS